MPEKNKNSGKKTIEITQDSPVDLTDISGSAEEIFATLKEAESSLLKQGFLSVRFGIDYDYDYTNLVVKLTRLESDREYERRIAKEEASMKRAITKAADDEKSQRALYEKLKKKFET